MRAGARAASTADAPQAPPDPLSPEDGTQLLALLAEAQHRGFLGPGPLQPHVTHSLGFAHAWQAWQRGTPRRILDLGAGGGLPGLILGQVWPEASLVLVDAQQRRVAFLGEAVAALSRPGPTEVIGGRAEAIARGPLREGVDYVTARGFGPPAVTAECAAAFLAPDGLLVVAEPPTWDPRRWPDDGLARVGLAHLGRLEAPATLAGFRRSGPLDATVPRRVGVPGKRPLWVVGP